MDWSSGSRTGREPYLRPHQKKERLPVRARGGFAPAPRDVSTSPPAADDPYWAWRAMSGWNGHSVMWRPRPAGIDQQERLTTMSKPSGPTGVQGSAGPGVQGSSTLGRASREQKADRAHHKRRERKECLELSATKALETTRVERSSLGYSPFMLEVRCTDCGAGCAMTLASAETGGTVAACLEEMLSLLQGRWEEKTCGEVRDYLTTLLVMET